METEKKKMKQELAQSAPTLKCKQYIHFGTNLQNRTEQNNGSWVRSKENEQIAFVALPSKNKLPTHSPHSMTVSQKTLSQWNKWNNNPREKEIIQGLETWLKWSSTCLATVRPKFIPQYWHKIKWKW
jgi:hypothetical protein